MSMEEEAMLYWKNQGQLSQIKLQKPTLAQLLSQRFSCDHQVKNAYIILIKIENIDIMILFQLLKQRVKMI